MPASRPALRPAQQARARGASTGLTTTLSVTVGGGATMTGFLTDPRVVTGVGSRQLQVQNTLVGDLTLTIGPTAWVVSGLQSSTIPLPGDGNPIPWSFTNPNPTSNVSGMIIITWMLSHQTTPQPDGPLIFQ